MGFPNTTFRSELPHLMRKEFDQSNADTAGYLNVEHDEEGHHTHISAKSLKVKGPVAITGGPLTINGAPVTPGGGTIAPHHATHEPGGSDALVGAAWTGVANTFTQINNFTTILASVDVAATRNLSAAAATFSPFYVIGGINTASIRLALGASNRLSVLEGDSSASEDVEARSYYESPRTVPLGYWIDVPFSAANFTASGGAAWTVAAGNVAVDRYTLIGKTLLWTVYLTGGSISGATPAELYIKIPGGFTVKPYFAAATAQLNDATERRGTVYGNTSVVTIQQNPYAFFNINSSTIVMFTITLEIN